MTRWVLLSIFVLASTLWAQTPIPTSLPPSVLRIGPGDSSATLNTVRLYGLYNGRFVSVRLGSGFQLGVDTTSLELVLSVPPSAGSTTKPLYSLAATKAQDGSWSVTTPAGSAPTGVLLVHFNGILQREGTDYTRDAGSAVRIIPVAGGPIATSVGPDLMTFAYPLAQ